MRWNSLAGTSLRSSVAPFLVLAVVLGASWTWIEYRAMHEDSQRIRREYLQSQEELIRYQVNRVIGYIEYMKDRAEHRMEDSIQSRLQDAFRVAEHLRETHGGAMSRAELQDLVREALRPLGYGQERGEFFIVGMDGVLFLSSWDAWAEGTNVARVQDALGRSVFRAMIDQASHQGEGRVEFALDGDGQGEACSEILYFKYFEPFNWIIGTGEYLADMEASVQREVLERVSNIRYGRDGYIYVLDFDGNFLSHIDQEYMAENQLGLRDSQGVYVTRELIDAGRRQGGGFVNYIWPKPSLGRDVAKLSYARAYEDWEWVVGTGVYLDDIEQAVTSMQERFTARTRNKLLLTLAIAAAGLLGWLFWIRVYAERIRIGVNAFGDFFRRAVKSNEPIETKELAFAEFKTMAEYANSMLLDRARSEQALKQSEERFRTLVEASPMGVVFYELTGKGLVVRDANPAADSLLNVPLSAHLGMTIGGVLPQILETNLPGQIMDVARGNATTFSNELELGVGGKQGIYAYHIFRPSPGTAAIIFMDVKARREAEESIRRSLAEKEVLLKEIHHRVKNNLQIISSLLYLQSEYVSDPSALDLFMESRNRIQAMALVHEELYRSPDLARVDLKEYMDKLVTKLAGTLGRKRLQCLVESEHVHISVQQAVPCGLIVSELVINAMKHAFENGGQGRVIARARKLEAMVELEVEDNGKGLPEGFVMDRSESLGMQLVTTLVRQLKGTVTAVNRGGALFTVHFPLEEGEP